jgi:hypothetical protein
MLGLLTGIALAALFLPGRAARRRALLRDRVAHFGKAAPHRVRGVARAARGHAAGLAHAVATHSPLYSGEGPDADEYVKHRVASEMGHSDLPLTGLVFDATDGLVTVRGTVGDEEVAKRIVDRVAGVHGVRAVHSLLRTPGGAQVGGSAGDPALAGATPRSVRLGDELIERLSERWPMLQPGAILRSDGHPDRLAKLIRERTGESEDEVRAALDEILLAAV